MKIPYSWLAEYIDLRGVDAKEVARLLTLRTCEVDAVHHVGAGLDDIVIGEVVECAPHPNADKLRITKVNIGRGELLPIVCGAPNVAKGRKVAVVPPGSKLPNGMTIGEREMRGQISRGMICSEKELGLGDDHDGILILEDEAVVGRKVTSLPSIEDWVIEIDHKSINHRPDLWGVYGFVRELQAILRLDSGYKHLPGHAAAEALGTQSGGFAVEIDAPQQCRRYLAAVIDSVTVGPSPRWMQRRLRLVGARPISNVVDVTNYVMFETAQPTHAFDRERLLGGRILVRTASDGESLTTLDGQKRLLQKSDLVIADGERAVALAGVMGGENSEVVPATTSIVLESANFDAATVRRTAARLGLRSEASTRFEKTLDPWAANIAVGRILSLLKEGFGTDARVRGPVTAAGEKRPQPLALQISRTFVANRLGVSVDALEKEQPNWTAILSRLGIDVRPINQQGDYRCDVPSFRSTKDLTEPIDLVEEIARLRGYENVVPAKLTAPVLPPPSQGARRMLVRRVEDQLVTLGFRGLESYSFLSDALIEQLGIGGERFVTVKNSIVVDQSRVRRSVLASLLGLVERNINHESGELHLFEVGKGYRPEKSRSDKWVGAESNEPAEHHLLAAVSARKCERADQRFDDYLLFATKARLKTLLGSLGLESVSFPISYMRMKDGLEFKPVAYLHPKRQLAITAHVPNLTSDVLLGIVGEIHPQVASSLRLQDLELCGFELDLAELEEAVAAAGPRRFAPIPRFPGINVDVALLAPKAFTAEQTEALVRSVAPQLCRTATLFDVYRGAELGDDKRSLAFHVELRADDRTLGEADESDFLRRLAANAAEQGLVLRGWQP